MTNQVAHSIPSLAVAERMLDRLLNVYGEPEVASIENFMDEYTEQLKHFDAEELSLGCKILLGTFKYRRWPRPAECIEACATARTRIKAREEAKLRPNGDRAGTFNIVTPRDLQFELWLDHLEAIGKHDLAKQARLAGEIATSSKLPSIGMEGFIATGPFQIEEPDTHDGLARVFSDGRLIR